MVLKQLEIQGFKSFPDRTRVRFENGITAVVGPNGSGKSNISDAIRWVLGETSSKQLRGTGKMEDVIFGGTQKRGAMGFASVQLTLDNTDRRFDVQADEVVIGRKYYRSGESDYSINGQNVRLKDVYELLLDTGLGRDGYSIIGQGRIAEIVGAKSGERREIFEEAAGIAKYRYRKNEAERHLAAAEENLVRLRDILEELQARVEPLRKDSEKATQFLQLAQQRKQLEITLWVDSVRRAKETVKEQQHRWEIAQSDYNACNGEIAAIDAQTEDVRASMQQLSIEIERHNAALRRFDEQTASASSQIAVLQNDNAHNSQSIQSIQQELQTAGEGEQSIAQQMQQHKQAIAQLEGEIDQTTQQLQQLEQSLQAIQTQNAATGERRGTVKALLAQLTSEQTAHRVQSATGEATLETANERLQTVQQQLQTLHQAHTELQQEKQENDAYLEGLTQTVTRLDNIKSGLQLKVTARKTALQQADEKQQQIARNREATTARLQMLKELERNMDGFGGSVKAVMRAAQNGRLRGVVGPVGSLLTVEKGYEIAIETALGFALQNIVVQDETAAKAAIALLQAEKAGRATFLPLTTVRGNHFAGQLGGTARLASKLVQYDAQYDGIVASLLGRIVVVDDLNEASAVAKQLQYRNRIVTLDGQVVNAGGSYTGGSTSRTTGVFSRKQELQSLAQQLQTLQQKQQQADAQASEYKSEVDTLAAQLSATESEAIVANGDKIRAEMQQTRIAAELAQNGQAQQRAHQQQTELSGQIATVQQQNQQAQQQAQQLAQQLATLEQELSQLAGSDDSFLQTRARLSDQLQALRMGRLAAEKDKDLHAAGIQTLLARQGEQGARGKQLQQNLQQFLQLNEQNKQKIAQLQQQLAQIQGEGEATKQKIGQIADQRLQLEGSIQNQAQRVRAIADQKEKLRGEIARLAERKAAAEIECDQTVAKLWDEYQLTATDAAAFCQPFETVGELRRQVAELRSKIRNLGNVNVGAIEEYKEVKQRYEFQLAQVQDVEQSKAELTRMIHELASEMQTIFSRSFEQINQNFGRIFSELFGGGSAGLTLATPEDVLNSGIDIQVAPPGKVIKSLTALSGGEQALVAISIYFAILAVNPAPFCVLDEIEAALDDENVARYAKYLRRITAETQFIVITHRRGTMEEADVLYGVTMQEDGISKLLRLNIAEVDAALVV